MKARPASLRKVFAGLLRGQREGTASSRKLFCGVVVDVSKLQAVPITGAAANNCKQLEQFSGKRRDELEMHLLSFLEFREGVQGESSFAQVMCPTLKSAGSRGVSSDHTYSEVNLESRRLALGRLAKSGLYAREVGPHRPEYEEHLFRKQCTFVT